MAKLIAYLVAFILYLISIFAGYGQLETVSVACFEEATVVYQGNPEINRGVIIEETTIHQIH
ncbi:hypothetical protein [Aquimarina pacifica]|uniref:hypothetical protein n=1 Tax=Aquimarina pacifica TaxID=1296415 RepID=UPI000471830F|nr:hypothetical protein [Aquimarina pacifica]